MEITGIVPHKQKKGVYRVYIDGRYSCSVHSEVLLKFRLKKGQKIGEIEKLRSAESLYSALNYALLLLKYCSRTEEEIYQRLRRKKYNDETITRTINKLEHLALLNDERLAQTWTENSLQSGKGMNLIRQELCRKGIDKNIIDDTIEKLKPTPEQEYESAKKLFKKKIKECKNLTGEKIYHRIGGYLARRGFSPDTINRLFRNWKEEFKEIPLGLE
jgi:regulatory protein